MTRLSAVLPLLLAAFSAAAPTASATTPDLRARIDARLAALQPQLVEIRRDLHQNAESAGNEVHASAVVATFLKELGLEVTTGVGGHGVVGILRGAQPGRTIAYRADMDAMTTTAADPEPFKSKDPNVNHVCGHDVHTTTALGIAAALAPEKEHIAGIIKFIFQPAEEVGEGAMAMIEDGVLGDPTPDAYLALHSSPLPSGTLFAIRGMALPGLETGRIVISGSGDLEAAAQEAVARMASVTTVPAPTSTEVNAMLVPHGQSYAVGAVMSADTDPESGAITLRTLLKASDDAAYDEARKKAGAALAELNGDDVKVEVTFGLPGLPPMVNHAELCDFAVASTRKVLGEENVPVAEGSIPFFGEDFSFFQEQAPGMMFFLGVGNEAKGINGMPHSPNFQADEAAIGVGARAMSALLLDWLDAASERAGNSR